MSSFRITRGSFASGFSSTTALLPPDLVQACAELVSTLVDRADLLSHSRPALETADGQNIQFREDEIPRSVRDVLRRYRIQTVGLP